MKIIKLLFMVTLILLPVAVFAEGNKLGSSGFNPAIIWPIAVFSICYNSRKKPIGGFLMFYLFQVYSGLLVTLLLTPLTLQNMDSSMWASILQYRLFMGIMLTSDIVLLGLAIASTFLIPKRFHIRKVVNVVRGMLVIHLIVALISSGLDIAIFKDNMALIIDGIVICSIIIWILYFTYSSRVRSVYILHDWAVTPDGAVDTTIPGPAVRVTTPTSASSTAAEPSTISDHDFNDENSQENTKHT